MFCTHCGSKIIDNSAFCSQCGKRVENEVEPPATISHQVNTSQYINRKKAYYYIFTPIVGLVVIFTMYAIASFIVGQLEMDSESAEGIMSSVNVFLGFTGIICVLGLIIGVPYGLIIMNKKTGELIAIKCVNCGHSGPPKKWNYKQWFNFLYIPVALNIVGLIYYLTSNPYICEKCNERNKLVKIFANGSTSSIRSMSTRAFSIITAIVLGMEVLVIMLIAFGASE